MNIETTFSDQAALEKAVRLEDDTYENVLEAAIAASQRIAPLWPLKSFVAVNPMLGFTDAPFTQAAHTLDRTGGAQTLMSASYFAQAIADNRLRDRHIATALSELHLEDRFTVAAVRAELAKEENVKPSLRTFADVASDMLGADWSGFFTDRISTWAAGYFDEGQSTWRGPWRHERPYAAWRAQAMIDRTPDIMGLKGFRKAVAALPADPAATLLETVRRLGVPPTSYTLYFHRLLTDIAGWAGHARYHGWLNELHGGAPEKVAELLAIRAGAELALYNCLGSDKVSETWRKEREAFNDEEAPTEGEEVRHILQTASEIAFREKMLGGIAANAIYGQNHDAKMRPDAQAVFCIDVRSERIRRAIENVNPSIETFGFAGFFGFPIEVARLGEDSGASQCPVLLEPGFLIRESDDTDENAVRKKQVARGVTTAWKRFKNAAVSSFAFVEAWGVGFLGAIVRDSLKQAGDENEPLNSLSLEPETCGGRSAGLDLAARLATAEGALAGMSLTKSFARLVLLVGHGSKTTNNPYASGLDCGACGGHTGEANARVAASALNDPAVRKGLAEKGWDIPADTVFVPALHNTTSDDITLLDMDIIPVSHGHDVLNLKLNLAAASRMSRRERAPSLGLTESENVDADVIARSRDWSEVRPEWGLAGCAAFIAAPRERTLGVDLKGRTFLHSYDWRADKDNAILELIMTAPLVVASWISLQYYGSTVDNKTLGSGDKTLHNVVGGLGVLEGNSGDLRPGLPMQSVHDGANPVHEPLRLCATIEAPIERINAVLEKHQHVRDLFDNNWLHLVAVSDEGRTFKRYDGDLIWTDIDKAHPTVIAA
ncbi:MAG: DUF2309 domain-containing protein [Pseudomonadota bacterium]